MNLPPWIPDNVTFYGIGDRKDDHMYDILPSRKFVFEFLIPIDGENQINLVCTDLSSQDLSLSMWFSEKPWGDMLFYNINPYIAPYGVPKMYMFDNVYFPTQNTAISIYDANSSKFLDKPMKLPAGKYYINIDNKQNRQNQFKLTFSSDADGILFPDSPNQSDLPVHNPNGENTASGEYGETCNICGYGEDNRKWLKRLKPCPSCGREGGAFSILTLR